MSTKVSLKAGIFGFEVDISEFFPVVRDLADVKLDAKAQKALKTMIEEVDKNFKLVVEVLMPLYTINTVTDFRQRWLEFLQNFKKQYLTQWELAKTRCSIVSDQLQRLHEAHNWKRRVPLIRNALRRLDEIGQKWMANDIKLYESMNGFMTSVNDALEIVNKHRKTPAKALDELRALLQGMDNSLLKIKACSNELERVSARL